MTPTIFKSGDLVTLTYEGQSIDAKVLLASPNGKSLMLSFDAGLWNAHGMFAGSLPVLQHEDGTYADLVHGLPVGIEHKPVH